jgi:hypothetical protein
MTDVADLVARAEAALGLPATSGESELVQGIPCSTYPIGEPWASQAKTMLPPPPAALDAAIGWLEARSPAWTVMTRERFAHLGVFTSRGLEPWLELPILVLTQRAALRRTDAVPLAVGPATSAAEFLAVYGAELAPLVTDGALADPDDELLVGRVDGRPVACARIRRALGAAYVSAITVLPAERGNGYGLAISAAASNAALATQPRFVWLSALPDVQPLYTRLGYRPVDTHVLLTRSA